MPEVPLTQRRQNHGRGASDLWPIDALVNRRIIVGAGTYGLGSVIRVGVGSGSGFGLVDLVPATSL